MLSASGRKCPEQASIPRFYSKICFSSFSFILHPAWRLGLVGAGSTLRKAWEGAFSPIPFYRGQLASTNLLGTWHRGKSFLGISGRNRS